MKKRRKQVAVYVTDAMILAVNTGMKVCVDLTERQRTKRKERDEKALTRKLLLVSMMYHAIGILYND